MLWEHRYGYYISGNGRFTIFRESAITHSGQWKLIDEYTKREYHGDSLGHAKYIAEHYIMAPEATKLESSGNKPKR